MNKISRKIFPFVIRRRIPPVLLLFIWNSAFGASPLQPVKIFPPASAAHTFLIGSSLLTAACIYTFDEQINRYYATPRSGLPYDIGRRMSEMAQFYGADNTRVAWFFAGLSSAFYAGGLLYDDEHMKKTALLLTRSMGYTLLATFGTKMIIGRARPSMQRGAREFYWFEFSKSKARRSFLSGHTATAFAMMTVLAREYPTTWVQVPVYFFALCVGAQRIATGEHWTSDVIVGGITGYWIGKAVTTRKKGHSEHHTSFTAHILPGYVGVTIYF